MGTAPAVLPRRDAALPLRDAGRALVLRAVGAALSVALSIVICRLLGAEGAGQYFTAVALATMIAVAAKLGLDGAVLRFVATSAATGQWATMRGAIRVSTRVAAAASALGAMVLFGAAPWLAASVFDAPDLVGPIRVIAPGIVCFAMMTLLAELLRGLKRIPHAMGVAVIVPPMVALATIGQLASTFGAAGAAASFVMGAAMSALIGFWLLDRAVRACPVAPPSIDKQALWASARPLWLTSLMNRAILPWAPVVFLSIWATAAEVGLFGVASRVALAVGACLMAANTALAPRFAELHAAGDIPGLRRLVGRFAFYMSVAASPVFLLIIVEGDPILRLFGPEFAQAATALAILAIGQAVSTLCGSVGYLLIMTGHEASLRSATVLGGVGLTVLSIILIPSFGLIGAALASAFGLIISNLAALWAAHRHLGLMPLAGVGQR
ncbi:MAG: oligosaccharide flippase family protein [Pseudomonadota bacterium]